MCKILTIAGINENTKENAWKLINKMCDKMSYHPNNDGLGYAAIDKDGNLFGEKWRYNRDAFTKRPTYDDNNKTLLETFKDVFVEDINDVEYKSYGERNEDNIVAITLHTRNATTPVSIANTHPFVDNVWKDPM